MTHRVISNRGCIRIAAACMISIAINIHAADNDYYRLDDIEALGSSPSLTVPDLDLAGEIIRTVPGGVNIVDSEDYLRGRSATVDDMLKMAPGVFVQSRFGAEEARISIRGSGLQRTFHGRGIMVLQDGVPINLSDGSFDMQAIEPFATRYTEVYRGANGLQYGSSNLGGVINFVSETGHTAPRLQLRLEAGSDGYIRGLAGAAGVVESLDYNMTVSEYFTEGFRDHSEQNSQRFFGNIGLRLSPDLETRFYITVVNTESELPGSLTRAELDNKPEQAATTNVTNDWKRDFPLYRIANKTTLRLDENLFEFGAYYAYKDLSHPIFVVINQRSDDFGINGIFTNSSDRFGNANRLRLGFNLTAGKIEDDRFFNVGGKESGRATFLDNDIETNNRNIDVFAENHHQVAERLALIIGVQIANAKRDYESESTSFDETFDAVLPKIGVLYDVGERSQVFANYSRSFEPPTFGELGTANPNLDEQTAWTLEFGSRGAGTSVAWDVAYYYSWIDNELLSLNDLQGNPLGTVNADDTIHHGIELGFDIELLSLVTGTASEDFQLFIRNSYLWGQFEFDGDNVFGDNQLAGFPEHLYRGELVLEHEQGFYIGVNTEWSPEKYPIDHANTFNSGSYVIFGIKAGYQAERGMSVFVEARNLADEEYATTTGVIANASGSDQRQFLPGDGRSFYAGIQYRW